MTTASPRPRKPTFGDDGEAFPRPFGNYILLKAFARGGMGEVYLAKRGAILGAEKYCVLKKLRPELTEDREYVARFIDEARVVVQLNHANICQVFDVGRVGSEYYLAMEYVSGRDVRSVQDRARNLGVRVHEASVLYLLAETLSALDYAHRRTHPMTGEPLNLVHRDVSPQNVMVSFEGEVKLIDFGLASSRLKVERTQPNIVMGKMAYMAPEQARGDAIDKRADLFAAGVVGYELLAGERFYEGMSSQEIWYVVGRGGFVPSKWTELSPDLARILAKALHPDPDSRYATCAEFRDNVMAYLHTRHPGLGERSLRELVQDLYADEIQRERDMLLGFAEVSGQLVENLLENTRSQSISLAHASDLVDPPQGGARVVHDERTRTEDSFPLSPIRTETAIAISDTGSGTGSGESGGLDEHTLLGEPEEAVAALHARTPPTGTLAPDVRGLLDQTRLSGDDEVSTHIAAAGSSERTARVERAPFGEVKTVSVPVDDPTGKRRLLIAAALALVVLTGAGALLFGGQDGDASPRAASATATVDDVPSEAPAASATEPVTEPPAPVDEAPADDGQGAVEPVDVVDPPDAPADSVPPAEPPPPVDDEPGVVAAAADSPPVPSPPDEVAASARRAQRALEVRRAREAREAKRAALARAKEEREAQRRAAAERARESRRTQAKPPARQQPRESLEQMVRVVMKCGLPSPCAKADIAVPFTMRFPNMDAGEKRRFAQHVRMCRQKCP